MLTLIAILTLCAATVLAVWRNRQSGARLLAGSAPWIGVGCIAACVLNLALAAQGHSWLTSARRDLLLVTISDRWALSDAGSVRLTAIVLRDPRLLPWIQRSVQVVEVRASMVLPRIPMGVCEGIVATRLESGEIELSADAVGGGRRTVTCSGDAGSVAEAVGALLQDWSPTSEGERNARAAHEVGAIMERVVLGDRDLTAWGLPREALERSARIYEPWNLLVGWPTMENTVVTLLAFGAAGWIAIVSSRRANAGVRSA